MSKRLTAIITEEDGGFVTLSPATDVASQGATIDEALANLKEALELYLEEIPDTSSMVMQPTFLTNVTI